MKPVRHPRRLGLVLVCLLFAITPAMARTLAVGPERPLKLPSDAAKVAEDGDVIAIDPGEYFDCAIWRAKSLTIEGAAKAEGSAAADKPVVITDRTCGGKALFVIDGADTTVRNITFTRARVPDGNGAGIRAEAANLTVEHCRFLNNQAGILAGDNPISAITVTDSEFTANGACSERSCVGALQVGGISRLRVERSVVHETKGGHQIVSRAYNTVLTGNRIEDGAQGSSSFLVQFGGEGHLIMDGNKLQKGKRTSNKRAAIMAGGNGWGSAEALVFRGNSFTNDIGGPATFLLNWTGASPVLENNTLNPADTAVSSSGVWLHRLRYGLVTLKDSLRHLAGDAKRGLAGLLHR